MSVPHQLRRVRLRAKKLVKAPPPKEFVTDRSKAVVLTWFSVACFGVRVSVMFHLMFVHYTFSSDLVAEWPPFGK